jgi:4-hydroxy-tetrahydrodipicolinate synthase
MRFTGIIPAVTTPFDDSGEVALSALGRNVEHVLDGGVHGIVGTGTMGESGSLTREERAAVLRTICSTVAGRVPVIAGVAAQTPTIAAGYIADAKEAGVSGFMVLGPLLYHGDEDELVAYFSDIADAAELPIILYNNPQATGYDLPAELIIAIAERVDGVRAVKECSGDVRRIPAILHDDRAELDVLVGGDDWSFEGLCVGACGWISGAADVVPGPCVRLYDAIQAGKLSEARELYRRLLPLSRFDMTPKLVQYYKAGLDEIGHSGGPTRRPRLPLSEAEHDELRAALALVNERVPA